MQSTLRRALTFNHLPKSVLIRATRTRPYAKNAAAAAEEPNPDDHRSRRRSRRSRKELEANVESFVNEYRAVNAGKFPPIKRTHRQVGGCYYRVRGILLELQHAAKALSSCGWIVHSLGLEGIGGSESLTKRGGVSAQIVSEGKNDTDQSVASDSRSEVKEESQMLSTVEILSEEVITPRISFDSDVTRNNIGQVNAEESSYTGLKKVDNGMEKHKSCEMLQGGFLVSHSLDKSEDSKIEEAISLEKVDKGMEHDTCEMLEGGFQVISHSLDKSEDSRMEEAQVDRHDCISKENHLQVGETITASISTEDATKAKEPQADQLDSIDAEKHLPVEETNRPTSSDDTDAVTEPDHDDLKCKMEQHEEILQADQLSKDLSSRPANDAEPLKISTTLWGAMKSLADGIINIFKN